MFIVIVQTDGKYNFLVFCILYANEQARCHVSRAVWQLHSYVAIRSLTGYLTVFVSYITQNPPSGKSFVTPRRFSSLIVVRYVYMQMAYADLLYFITASTVDILTNNLSFFQFRNKISHCHTTRMYMK
jgi:hypothetical protein